MSGSTAIAARSLSKHFGRRLDAGVLALDDVTFEVAAGSALGIVGENGSGKSTLLDLLLGLTLPTTGSVDVAGPVASLLELGAGFFGELTGRENAVQTALLSGASMSEARMLANGVQEFAELDGFFDRPIRTYSAGMLMRLGFATAANLAAPVTVVDEVLAVGDGYFQRKCIDRLLEMRERKTTLVVASHDLHALRGLCDRVLWLRHGRAEALGAADEVIGRYEEHLRLRAATGERATRHGTGEVQILSVRLLDASGEERMAFPFGGTLRVEVVFETTRSLDSPVMGVALFREDGVYCHGPNTRFDKCLFGLYDGRYRLTAEFARLPLLAGQYEVSVAFYDKDHVYAYAWEHRMYPFRVVEAPPDHGVVRLDHRFDVEKVADRR